MKLAGKKALVTGAARGIGKGCALELARAGADVAINDRSRTEQAEAVVAEIRALGRQAFLVEGDVFARSSCEDVTARAIESLGRIDILVSNPAYSRRGAFLKYDPADFERTLNGTLASGFHMSQLVARHLVEKGTGGKIIFISSVQAEMPFALCAPYGAAKAGLNHMMRSISVELAAHRINVNAIEPGWIDTPGERESFAEETIQAEGLRLPWGRMGLPEDIGKAAVFLSSDDADYITGVVLPVDGGFRHKDCRPEKVIKPQP